MSLLRQLWELLCRVLARWGWWYCRRREFVSPVIGVDGAFVRPGEVMVDVAFEAEIADQLRKLGGRPYRPSDDQDDWRQRPYAPGSRDVNGQLAEAGLGFRLWVGFSTRQAVKLVQDGELPGVYFNLVYRGDAVLDYYQGGGEGFATADAGPPAGFPAHTGDGTVDIAVFDTGIPADWTTDPDLQNRVTVVANGIDPLSEFGNTTLAAKACHGLFICGLIGRLRTQLDIASHRVMFSTGETDDTTVCPVMINSGGAVLNLSFGGHSTNNVISPVMADAVAKVVAQDRILVAAAGNFGGASAPQNRHFWPAAHPDVIAVGAFESTAAPLKVWSSSNRADVYAPGVDLLSMHAKGWNNPETGVPYQGWAKWSGTSFATPVVAALLAEEVMTVTAGRWQHAMTWLAGLGDSDWLDKPGQSGQGKLVNPTPALTSW